MIYIEVPEVIYIIVVIQYGLRKCINVGCIHDILVQVG